MREVKNEVENLGFTMFTHLDGNSEIIIQNS